MHKTDEPPADCPHSKLLKDGLEHNADMFLERLKGWYSVAVKPFRDENGQIFGYIRRKPESLLKVIHPDDVALYTNTMQENQSTGKVSLLEYRIILRDGSVRYLFGDGKVEYDANGKPIKSVGTVQDISERKKKRTGIDPGKRTGRRE